MSLKGKTALITGSTSGIGMGIATTLAGAGVNVIINGFGDTTEISLFLSELERCGVQAIYSDTDLSTEEGAIELYKAGVEKFGKIDILVNNAGIQHVEPIETFPAERWDKIIGLMLSAPFYLTKAVLPNMKKQKWGRIINIASAHGLVASPKKAAYVSAKHGLNGLTKVTALECANTGVTCNSICPGWVLTPPVKEQVDVIARDENMSWEEAKTKLLSEKQPQTEFTTPEEIGELALFLCSDGAKNMTGAQMPIDGGWQAR